MSRLYVVRHGETDFNRDGRYQGTIDVSLNDAGRAQAERAAERIAALGIEQIFSSPLLRARETAEVIAARVQLPVQFIGALAERGLGRFEGQTKAEIAERFPGIWDGSPTRQMFEAPPEAESLVDLTIRVHGVYRDLYARFSGRPIVLVCHGGVARTFHGLLRRVSDSDYFAYKLANGEIDAFDWTPPVPP